MSRTLRYGIDTQLRLPDRCAAASPQCATADMPPDDVSRAIDEALSAPLGYPPLSQALVSGDRVAIAIGAGVPHSADVAAVVARRIATCGVDGVICTILCTSAADADAHRSVGSTVEIHDPDDRTRLGYLTNTPGGHPIYLNRALLDADLVIPLVACGGGESWLHRGPAGAVYPTFSDRATYRRYGNPQLFDAEGATFARSQQEIESVARQLGIQLLTAVVPGSGDCAAAVAVGEFEAVRRRAAACFAERHRRRLASSAEVVVAGLNGRAAQTWNSAAAALAAAASAVEEGGTIVLCTDLDQPLGPGMELLRRAGEEERDAARRRLRRTRPHDLFAALQWAATLDCSRIFLLSRLADDVVEELGATPIDDPDDVVRLVERRRSCLIVDDAQHAEIQLSPAAERGSHLLDR